MSASGVADELFGLRVEFQVLAEGELVGGNIDVVRGEMRGEAVEGIRGILAVLELVLDRTGRGLLAEAVGDVAGVAERAGDVAVEDLAVQVGGLPAAHAVEEVGVVVFGVDGGWHLGPGLVFALRFGGFGKLLNLFPVGIVGDGVVVVRAEDVALFILHDDALHRSWP